MGVGKQAKNSKCAVRPVRDGVDGAVFGHIWVCCLGRYAPAAIGHGCGSRHLGLAGPGDVYSVWCVGRQEGWFSEMLTKTEPHTSFVDFDFLAGDFFFGGVVFLIFLQKLWRLPPSSPGPCGFEGHRWQAAGSSRLTWP